MLTRLIRARLSQTQQKIEITRSSINCHSTEIFRFHSIYGHWTWSTYKLISPVGQGRVVDEKEHLLRLDLLACSKEGFLCVTIAVSEWWSMKAVKVVVQTRETVRVWFSVLYVLKLFIFYQQSVWLFQNSGTKKLTAPLIGHPLFELLLYGLSLKELCSFFYRFCVQFKVYPDRRKVFNIVRLF